MKSEVALRGKTKNSTREKLYQVELFGIDE